MAFALSTLRVTSPAFDDGAGIPARYTGEGDDISPAIVWQDAPQGTKGFALICHDPDAPLVQNGTYGFVHWVLYNIPASTTSLEEASRVGTKGKNDFGKLGYGGPMPPEGHGVHRYYFWVLALDKPTDDLPEGLSLRDLLIKVEPHLLGMNRLVGTYRRG